MEAQLALDVARVLLATKEHVEAMPDPVEQRHAPVLYALPSTRAMLRVMSWYSDRLRARCFRPDAVIV